MLSVEVFWYWQSHWPSWIIELDYGKILTGKPYIIFDGKNPWDSGEDFPQQTKPLTQLKPGLFKFPWDLPWLPQWLAHVAGWGGMGGWFTDVHDVPV